MAIQTAQTYGPENQRYSNLVKFELEPALNLTREVITVNEAAAKTYTIGTVLGKVTANGKYKIAVETAVDGSKVPAAVVVEDLSVAATTDTKVLSIVRGHAILSKGALKLDASYNDATKLATAYAALADKFILVSETA